MITSPQDVWMTIASFLYDANFIALFHTCKRVSYFIGHRKLYPRREEIFIGFTQFEMIRNVFREETQLYRWSIQMKYVTREFHRDVENMVEWDADIETIKLMIPLRDHLYKDDSEACYKAIEKGRFDLFCLIFDERLKIGFHHTINTEKLVRDAFKLIDSDCEQYDYETLLRLLKYGKASLLLHHSDDIERYINCSHGSDQPDYDSMTPSEKEDYWKHL